MKKFYSLIASVLIAGSCVQSQAQDYSDGVFILNEDWYGHNNSSLNFWNHNSGYVDYYIMQIANGYEYSLGCTAQHGQLYGERIIISSKQDRDPGESGTMKSGRITVLDRSTLKALNVIPVIETNDENKSIADGRGVCFVNNDKAYLGTSNGIFIMNMESAGVEGRISGTENDLITGDEDNADGIGPLYNNQIGIMLRTQDYVFAIKQDLGILVIDPESDKITKIIEGCFSTMVQSKDGNIWAGMNVAEGDNLKYPYGNNGDAWVGTRLMCINQYTLETKIVDLSEGGVPQSWYAWTAGTMTAGTTDNALYFVYTDPSEGQDSWFRNCNLYRYDIDEDVCSLIYNSEIDGLYFYGGAIQCSPKDGNIYAALYVGENIATQEWVYMILDKDGQEVAFKQPIENYWYPAMFIFPDNEAPVVSAFDDVTLGRNAVEINLAEKVTDADSPNAAIIKTVKKISDTSVVDAKIEKGNLILTPINQGNATVEVEFNSNGKTVTRSINVTSTVASTACEEISDSKISVFTVAGDIMVTGIDDATTVSVYNAQGVLVKELAIDNAGRILGLDGGNLYIVRISNKSFKIIL